MNDELTTIRRYLHQHPELSNVEYATSRWVRDFLGRLEPAPSVEEAADTGIIATFEKDSEGRHLLFRCELDALPIQEVNDFEYRSVTDGISHKCGHDGHMTILIGLAKKLSEDGLRTGRVTLLFQPAEETGDGARNILSEKPFDQNPPDQVYALHNVPGFPMHGIVVKEGAFNPAVKTMVIRFVGKTAHAAEPENGFNPAFAMAKMVLFARSIEQPDEQRDDFQLIVPVHSLLGEKANGVSAGNGEMRLTIRCWTGKQMEMIIQRLSEELDKLTHEYVLETHVSFEETFESCTNDPVAVSSIRRAADMSGFAVIEKAEPFKWGEDFGLFSSTFPGAMFGLGSGEDCPALHNPDYDFPDEILPTGIEMFYGIIKDAGLV